MLVLRALRPPDIRLTDDITSGSRITSPACISCKTGTSVCPADALKRTFALDVSTADHLPRRAASS